MTFTHHLASAEPEHPFAPFVRILGKGQKGSRSLTRAEARAAMQMVLQGEVRPEQLGAFLVLLRVKEETPEELAGFIEAAQTVCGSARHSGQAELDWPSYAGKRRHLPWFILAALLLAENGVRVLMHGSAGPAERLYADQVLPVLNLQPARSLDEAAAQLNSRCFSFVSLEHLCPPLQAIIDLRPVLGLRSPVHTLARMLNPLRAPFSLQGIFHPSYRSVHQAAAALVGQPHMAVMKGEGGETERNPDGPCLVQSVDHGEMTEQTWPALFERRHIRPERLDPQRLTALWEDRCQDDYGVAAVTGTVAVALKLLGKASDQAMAGEMATQWWQSRHRRRFQAHG